jgi:tetratricopeptide (TPR) repeat protein
MGLARRRLLHRRIAETLIQQARARRLLGPLAGQVAHHYQRAGQEAQAAEYCKLAGEQSRALFANQEALAHFQMALALGHSEVVTLQEAIGDLQTLAGDYRAALAAYETAAARAAAAQLPDLEHKLGLVHSRQGAWELAERHFQSALDLQPDAQANPGPQARLYMDWCLVAHRRQQPERARVLAQQALALAQNSDDRRVLAQAHNLLGLLSRHQQELAQAVHHLEHSLTLAKEVNDPYAQVAALNNLALALRAQGDRAQAIALTQSALHLCATLGDRHREAALHNNLADLLRHTGQRAAAQAHVKQAVTLLAAIGEPAESGVWQREIWRLNEW